MQPEQIELLYQVDWLRAQLQLTAARERMRDALDKATAPHFRSTLWARLAEIYSSVGDVPQALHCLHRALNIPELEGHAFTQAGLQARILLFQWSQAASPDELQAAYQGLRQILPPPTSQRPSLRKPNTNKPVRIGYLSPDFRNCSVARVIEPLLRQHAQQSEHELFAYDLSAADDLLAQHYRQLIPHWRVLQGQAPAVMRQMIQADELDILVDLAGITSASALGLLSEPLAPIQLTGLSFNGPVGLPQFEARFGDVCSSPQGHWSHQYEKLLPLPSWIWSEMPPRPEIPTRPAGPDGLRRLGCAHHPGRLNASCLKLWAEILARCPEAELHLKHRYYGSAWCRAHTYQRLKEAGIPEQRAILHGESTYPDYLQFYQNIDLVLDPFPYHGGLVSLDALWMGRPLVSLSQWMQGGESLLRQVGWPLGVALSETEYLEKALALLKDKQLRDRTQQQILKGCQTAPCFQVEEVISSYLSHLRALTQ